MIAEKKENQMNLAPALRSGEWSDIGERPYMEDTHICIGDLAKKFNYNSLPGEAVSFYGVSYSDHYANCFLREFLVNVSILL